jgi:uncharacterized membrane protein
LGINVVGGLFPLSFALYQFIGNPPSSILIVIAIVAVVSYLSVKVESGRRIYSKCWFFWVVLMASALSVMWVVVGEIERTDVSVAFASVVLGDLIGLDLLHLKDLQPKKAVIPLGIGGAVLNNGIVLCGFYSLLITE